MPLEERLDALERKYGRIKLYVIGLCVATLALPSIMRGGNRTDALELVDPRKGWRCEIFMETADVANGREWAEVQCRFFDEDNNHFETKGLIHSDSLIRR